MSLELKELDIMKALSLCLPKWVKKNKRSFSISVTCYYDKENSNDNGIEVHFSGDDKGDNTLEKQEEIVSNFVSNLKETEIILQLSIVRNYLDSLRKDPNNTSEINQFLDKQFNHTDDEINKLLDKFTN